MANFVYDHAAKLLLDKSIDFVNDDIRMLLVMTNTTADTEKDKATISGFTTLDEYNGSAYARQALTTQVTVEDNANHRGEFQSDNVQFAGIGAGSRQAQAIVLFKFITNDSDHIPIAYIDTTTGATFPFTGNGGNVNLNMNAQGWLQTQA